MKNDAALMTCAVFFWSIPAILPLPAQFEQFEPTADLKDDQLRARLSPAKLTQESDVNLSSKGYVLIGHVGIREDGNSTCYGPNCAASLSCPSGPVKKDLTRELLEKAASHGGDLVTLARDNSASKVRDFKLGKCTAHSKAPGKVVIAVPSNREQPGRPPGSWENKTVQTGVSICSDWETIEGFRCAVISEGSVWRFAPNLPKRIAERAAERAKGRTGKIYVEDPGGMTRIRENDKWGYEDETGTTVAQPQFDEASSFTDGLARVRIGAKYGVIDKIGKFVVREEFKEILYPSEGLAATRVGEQWGYIDKNGQYVIKPQFYAVKRFSEGLAAVRVDNGDSWGYIDRSGQWVIQPKLCDARDFSGGLAPIGMKVPEKRGRFGVLQIEYWGYINKDGLVVIKPTFDYAHSFSEDLAVVMVNHKYGYINRTGEFAIKPQFDDADEFADGKARVKVAGKEVFIDKSGRIVD